MMKKILLLVVLITTLSIIGCSKDEGDSIEVESDSGNSNSSTTTSSVTWSDLEGIWIEFSFFGHLNTTVNNALKGWSKSKLITNYSSSEYYHDGLRISSDGTVKCTQARIASSCSNYTDEIETVMADDGIVYWVVVDNGTNYGVMTIENDCMYDNNNEQVFTIDFYYCDNSTDVGNEYFYSYVLSYDSLHLIDDNGSFTIYYRLNSTKLQTYF